MLAERFLYVCFVSLPEALGVPRSNLLYKDGIPRWAIVWIRWLGVLAAAPIVIWIFCMLMPAAWVLGIGLLFDECFWRYLKETGLDDCFTECRSLSFGLIATPLSWILCVVATIRLQRTADERVQWILSKNVSARPNEARLLSRIAQSPWWSILLFASSACWVAYTFIATGAMRMPSWRHQPPKIFTTFPFAVALGIVTAALASAWFSTRYRARVQVKPGDGK